jgi:hypothetical protein
MTTSIIEKIRGKRGKQLDDARKAYTHAVHKLAGDKALTQLQEERLEDALELLGNYDQLEDDVRLVKQYHADVAAAANRDKAANEREATRTTLADFTREKTGERVVALKALDEKEAKLRRAHKEATQRFTDASQARHRVDEHHEQRPDLFGKLKG